MNQNNINEAKEEIEKNEINEKEQENENNEENQIYDEMNKLNGQDLNNLTQ